MGKQIIFTEKYTTDLKRKVASGLSVDFYKSRNFVYDQMQVQTLKHVEVNTVPLNKLDPGNDFQTAVNIYEVYSALEPIQASDERLWTYLAHVDFYPYMIERWPEVFLGKAANPKKYILDHWFLSSTAQGNLMRHALSGLWWSVFLSIDEDRTDRYELTKILFKNQTLRTRTFGNYKLVRHKEAAIGLLEFILENEGSFSNFEKEHQYLTEHLNRIGGLKPLSYYDRNFFKSELQKISKDLFAA